MSRVSSFLFLAIFLLAVVSNESFRFQIQTWKQPLRPLLSNVGEDLPEAAMSIDEIKAELDIRDVNYDDCLSKSELVRRLAESRVVGKADPEILKKMNEEYSDMNSDIPDISEDVMQQAVAKDGKLPGGMSPEMIKALTADPEIMQMMRDPKMQDIMTAVMTGGPDAMKKYLSDPDALKLLQRLSTVMGKHQEK